MNEINGKPPEPLAPLSEIEAEIDDIREDAAAIANEWAIFCPDAKTPEAINQLRNIARCLLEREASIARRRRALNERFSLVAPLVAPQPAPVAPVKAKRGEVMERVAGWIEGCNLTEIRASELAGILLLNPGSVRDALRSLAEDGVLERSGRGIFIVRGAKPAPATGEAARADRIQRVLDNARDPLSGCDEEAA